VRFASVSSNSLGHVQILFKVAWVTVRRFIIDVCVLVKKVLTIVIVKTVEMRQINCWKKNVRYLTAWDRVIVEKLVVLNQ